MVRHLPYPRDSRPRRATSHDIHRANLHTEQGYEVVCFLADVGQEEDWDAVRAKALKIGAQKMYVSYPDGGTMSVLEPPYLVRC